MSQPDIEEEAARRDYKAPYSHNHPIPTIQRYREHRGELQGQQQEAEDAQHSDEDDSELRRAFNSVKSIVKDEDRKDPAGSPYPTANRNYGQDGQPGDQDSKIPTVPSADGGNSGDDGRSETMNVGNTGNTSDDVSATEKAAGHTDPKQKRKEMKHNKRDDGGREVTDPVTHLPLIIRDSTEKDLRRAPQNKPAPGMRRSEGTDLSSTSKSSSEMEQERSELQQDYDGMQSVFPPPSFDDARAELANAYRRALTMGLGAIVVLASAAILLLAMSFRATAYNAKMGTWWHNIQNTPKHNNIKHFEGMGGVRMSAIISIFIATMFGLGGLVLYCIRGWLDKKVEGIWKDEVWESARLQEQKSGKESEKLPESVAWMNSLLASVWPLINPDLFTSVVDMLEDVMQASLPKIIRMVSVDDLGQGSEAIRILGIRWLPTAAAAQSVDDSGNLKPTSSKEANDRGAPGQGEEEDNEVKKQDENEAIDEKKDNQKRQEEEQEQQAIREGMEAEQGDFVNMELAFSYRARPSGKSIESKAKNAHLYLKFYLPGGIFVPVWVELRGIIGTLRLRLQLTPDPPFFSLCTLTFLGQPRADLSCVPLSKHLPNLMNVPLISSFVQSSIDAALAEYVAPKSLTLDLKDMLVGDDFKTDTIARGVIVIYIKEAHGFKEGDGGIGPIQGSSDAYVTCSWGKFGKTISSTRIIEKDQDPKWFEWAYMLVTPEELNADEKLRLQLWDSDKHTADDDLGRVEVDLKELMHSPKTKNRMSDREDRFRAQDPEEKMPGTLSWSVGYYSKTRITKEQLAHQTVDESIVTKEDLKQQVSDAAANKLREATAHDESKELGQQKAQDYKERENALICSSPPDPQYPSGILSIQIHNITGLEVEALQKQEKNDSEGREDEAEQSKDLPSSYCTIILDHKKIYMTRTKPKNAKPFFNAGTERFIRDFRVAEVMVSVRDSRDRENDALLGIVYLPLKKVFEKRSQVMDLYPLVGGIGFGRARISMVFRSIELQMPKELLGWDLGTLELMTPVRAKSQLPQDLQNHRIKLRSNISRVKMSPGNGEWRPKHSDQKSQFLACRKRYSMPLIVEFRKSSIGLDSTPAFAVFWLKDIPDEEEKTVTIKVWAGGKENLKRATTCGEYEGLRDGEKPLGEIEITMKFWKGLSGYHKRYAQKGDSGDMRSVMEVLDTVNDEIEDSRSEEDSDDSESSAEDREQNNTSRKHLRTHTNDDSSGSENEDTRNAVKKILQKPKDLLNSRNDPDDGSRGVQGQLKDYQSHRKQLHRKHRGLMQWKGMRTANWALDKVRNGKTRVGDVFNHEEKTTGIETEV